jgi:hypothetical protein
MKDPTIDELAHALVETTQDKIGTSVAAASILSPWWHDKIAALGSDLALLMPILGVLYLLLSICVKGYELAHRNDR